MKNSIYAVLVFAAVFTACTGMFDKGEEEIIDKGFSKQEGGGSTTIQFDNTRSGNAASIYSSRERSEDTKITDVSAGQFSKKINWQESSSTNFYISYDVSIEGVQLNYTPAGGQFPAAVESSKNTVISVPAIADYVQDAEEPLLPSAVFLVIGNTGAFGFTLQKGAVSQLPVNGSSSTINGYAQGVYKINAGDDAQMYKVSCNTADYPLSAALGTHDFTSGALYFFEADASRLALKKMVMVNRQNLGGSPVNPNPGRPSEAAAITLSNNEWKSGTLYAGETYYYQFQGIAGRSYYVQWDDSYAGSGTQSADICVSVSLDAYTEQADNGYSNPLTVTPSASTVIYLRVAGYALSSEGTYRIRYYTR
jgi:hypothetical protein